VTAGATAGPGKASDLWARVCLVWLTLALGYGVYANGARAIADLSIVLAGLAVAALAYWLGAALTGAAPAPGGRLQWLALLLPSYVAFQLIPLPVFLLRFISPERASAVDSMRLLVEPGAFASLSVEPAGTFVHLFRAAGCLLLFLLIRDIASRLWPRRSWSVVLPLIVIAAAEASIGIAQSLSGANVRVRGTYVNRNHFAGLMEMALPLCLACAAGLLRRERSSGGWHAHRAMGGYVVLSAAAAIFLGLLRSDSKTGLAAGLGGVFVMGAVWAATNLPARRTAVILGLATVCALVFVAMPSIEFILALGHGVMADSSLDLEGRAPIWSDTFHLVGDYPIFGSGLGTYPTAFLRYQTSGLGLHFEFAHNDYLQLAAELGLAGLLLLGALVWSVVRRAVRASVHGPDESTRFLGLGCLGAFTAIAVHSFTDFNLYIPPNALVLVWIAGIAAILPEAAEQPVPRPGRWDVWLRRGSIVLSLLLLAYAAAWHQFATRYREDEKAERVFCRFGICDTYAVIRARSEDGSAARVDAELLREGLRRSPADPVRWADLGSALEYQGRLEEARYCFSRAIALAPNSFPTQWAAAEFHANLKENARALELTAPILEVSTPHQGPMLAWYEERGFAAHEVMSALSPYPAATKVYFRHLLTQGRLADAQQAWREILARRYADLDLARGYVYFLMRTRQYEAAAQAWADFLGDRKGAYRESNWVYNGSFEQAPSGSALDWATGDAGSAETSLDSSVAHTGSQSLRIRFRGRENVNYRHVSQTVVVHPGMYRFEAFVKTEAITTPEGIRFEIYDGEAGERLRIETESMIGTQDWTRIERRIRVPQQTRILRIQVVRRPVRLKFDDKISGTAWIDSVRLERLN